MEFIVKGIEDKKNQEISQLRKQITSEFRFKNQMHIQKIVIFKSILFSNYTLS